MLFIGNMSQLRSRKWCFTINNYSTDDEHNVQRLKCHYCVCGYEEAPETGTPHLQGYVEFKNALSLQSLKKKLPRAHLEPAKGDHSSNKKYCTKSGKFFEEGEPFTKRPGTRTDLQEVSTMIKSGLSLRDIYTSGLGYQACRHAEKLIAVLEPPRSEESVKVIWVYGKPGVGKTYIPWKTCKILNGIKLSSIVFAQMYDRHEYVVIDDIRPTDSCCGSYANLLHFLDPYDHILNVKHGSRQLCAKVIFITSPVSPELFSITYNPNEDSTQLHRRIHQVFNLSKFSQIEELKKYCIDIIQDADASLPIPPTLLPTQESEHTANPKG